MIRKLLILPILAVLMVGAVFAANPETSECTYTGATPNDDVRYDKETDSFTFGVQFTSWNITNATFYLSGTDKGLQSWFIAAGGDGNASSISKTINLKDVGIKDARHYSFYATFDMDNNTAANDYNNFTSLTGVTCPTREFSTDFDTAKLFSVVGTDVDATKDNKLRNSLMLIVLVGVLVLAVNKKK